MSTPRSRGVYRADCEFCGTSGPCRLVQHEDRYRWRCAADCTPDPEAHWVKEIL